MSINPFPHRGSMINLAFSMALKGTTLSKIRKFAELKGGDAARLIRTLRLGEKNGIKWKVEEGVKTDIFKIVDGKRKRQAAGAIDRALRAGGQSNTRSTSKQITKA